MITLGDRAAGALENARLQAMRNGNMGQLDGYRRNHVVILAERVQAEERERCARIADEYARETLPVDPGGVARLIAGRIRNGTDPVAVAPVPDLAGAAPVAEAGDHE